MTDILATLKAMYARNLPINRLNPESVTTLHQLGLATITTGPWGQKVANLTELGRQRLSQMTEATVTPSPCGRTAERQLSDVSLRALHNLSYGEPPSPIAGQKPWLPPDSRQRITVSTD